MAERSRDRSSSNESQPKFPECSHFRRRNDNHRRCQQCRLNVGLPLCTQDSPCLVCQDWLPEAWTAHAKATAQRNRRKAAAAAKAARKETEMMDSVELHAPRHAFPTKRPKSEESSKTKWSKTVASSSQPKSVASSVSAAERPSSHRSGHRRLRNLRGISRHVVAATAVTGERASGTGQVPLVGLARVDVPSPAVSQRRRTPVRRALPLAITARDDERAPTGRVGRLLSDESSSYPLRSPRPMRNALSQWLPLQLDIFILNRPQQFQSRPR